MCTNTVDGIEKPEVWVRWPGGQTLTTSIPKEAKEIEIGQDGKVKVIR